MKKILIYGVAAVIVVAAVVVVLVSVNKDDKKDSDTTSATSTTSSSGNFKTSQACNLLTLADAKQLLGDSATAGDNAAGGSESDDVKVTTCTYTRTAAQLSDIATVSVLVRSPKTKTGADSNKTGMSSTRPAAAKDVSGYGDTAFWNPELGQLNVLKGNTWLIISNVKGTRPDQGKQADTEAAAKLILARM